jgi:hypothetical protein
VIEMREPTEPEAVTAMETLGDSPSWFVWEDGRLVAICFDEHDAIGVAEALEETA